MRRLGGPVNGAWLLPLRALVAAAGVDRLASQPKSLWAYEHVRGIG